MPITITKRLLSGSVDGLAIGITATQGATYATIHTGTSGATSTIDEVWLYAQNNFSQAIELVLEWGQSATPTNIVASVPPKDGPVLVVPGLLLLGSATAATDIVAYYQGVNGGSNSLIASAGGAVSIFGYVNRIVQT